MSPSDILTLGENGGRVVIMFDVFDELKTGCDIQRLDRSLDPGNQGRACTQLIHTEPQQQRREQNVASHLTANAHPQIVGVTGINHHPN